MSSQIIRPDNCRSCKHFEQGEAEQGLCRRYPPTFQLILIPTPEGAAVQANSQFPMTDTAQWCGEYATRLLLQ